MAGEDFISEVDSSVKEQRVVRVVLPVVAAVSILILGGIWAWSYWGKSNVDEWMRDTGIYYEDSQIFQRTGWVHSWEEPESFPSEEDKEKTLAIVNAQKEAYDAASASMQYLSQNSSSPYVRFLSTLALVSDSADRSNVNGIKQYATYFIDDKSNNEGFRDMMSLYLARYLISFGEEQQAIDMLTTFRSEVTGFTDPK